MNNSVREQSAAVVAQSRHWPLITALLGGTGFARGGVDQDLDAHRLGAPCNPAACSSRAVSYKGRPITPE